MGTFSHFVSEHRKTKTFQKHCKFYLGFGGWFLESFEINEHLACARKNPLRIAKVCGCCSQQPNNRAGRLRLLPHQMRTAGIAI